MPTADKLRCLLFLIAPCALVPATGSGAPSVAMVRYTAATAEQRIELAASRAASPSVTEPTALAALAAIEHDEDDAPYPVAQNALLRLAESGAVPAEARGEARLLAQAMAPADGSSAGAAEAAKLGVLGSWWLLGPLRDTGGGLEARDADEAETAKFLDRARDRSWGAYDVRWRPLPDAATSAAGVPLDRFVHPRTESCSYLASTVVLPATPVVLRVAATGQVRLSIDGATVSKDDGAHTRALFDRLAARIEGPEGPHLVVVKSCSGTLPDEGRVRVRATRDDGTPIALETRPPTSPGRATLRATPIRTSLARALADGEVAGLASRLAAATLRTLGGADDSRSPRAPGMLDAVVEDRALTADALAFAAAIAPAATHRSGWASLAMARAKATGDSAARAFAQRLAVRNHLEAGYGDWALAEARGAGLEQATDDEAIALVAAAEQRVGLSSLRLQAKRRTERALDGRATAGATALLERALAVTSHEDRARRGVLARVLAARGHHLPLADEATASSSGATIAAATAAFDEASSADEALASVHALERVGAWSVASRLLATLAAWSPNREDVWSRAARAATMSGPGAEVRVASLLERARKLDPTDATTRAEMRLRTPRSSEAKSAPRDLRFLEPTDRILARRRGAPKTQPPDVADRELHWLRAVTMHDDGRVSQLIQYAREIVIPPRNRSELEESLPTEGGLVEILQARVHRARGGIAFPSAQSDDPSEPSLQWPELEPGDTVEVVLRSWTRNAVGGRADPPYYFLDYGGATSSHPLLYNRVVVDFPRSRPLHVALVRPGAHKRVERDEGDRHLVDLIWDAPPQVPSEPFAPQTSEIVPLIVGSTFRDWDDFRAWYMRAVDGFTVPDAQVKRLALELTRGKPSRDAKVRALFNFVADDIRYVNYVSGEWWLPNRPQQLLARREGDCDDKALLLITLLRAIGIEATEVLVQTRHTGSPSALLARGAVAPLFDHGIAFLPGKDGGTYLDATGPKSRIGPLPSMDARAPALRLDGPAEIVTLPSSSPDDHGSEVRWEVRIDARGGATVSGNETHRGDGAYWLRTQLAEADARKSYLEAALGGWLPAVALDPTIEFDGERPMGEATLRYSARTPALARSEGAELVVPLAPPQTLASRFASLKVRTLPVVLPPELAPSRQARTLRLHAPPGFVWEDSHDGGVVDGGVFGRAELSIALSRATPEVLEVRRQVTFDRHAISVEEYPRFRAWLLRVDALMNRSARLTRAGGAR